MKTWIIALFLLTRTDLAHYKVEYQEPDLKDRAEIGCKVDEVGGEGIRHDWIVKGYVHNVPRVEDFEKTVARADKLEKAMKECRAWIEKEKREVQQVQRGLK